MKHCLTTIKIFSVFYGFLLYSFIYASEIKDEVIPTDIEALRVAITKLIEENEVPAVSIAMVDENGPVWVGAIGKANIENNILADENTLFRIGSTSKMFVALSVLKLVEEGKLSLDDKLSDLAPEIAFKNQWSDTDPIRLVHLLEHTTGWDDLHLTEYAHNDPTPSTLKQGLDYHPHSRVSRWKPGSRMSYCNSGPPVAAYIVQKNTGMDFEKYVQENFFNPMEMSKTTYFLTDEVKTQGATLYANGNQPQDYWHIIMRPSGSINSSANDMANFVKFYINRGKVNDKQLISPESLIRMETAVSNNGAKAGQKAGYGLNNYTTEHKSWVFREHNGGVNGGLTELAYLPEAKVGHIIMINSDDYSTFKKISKLIRNYETRNLSVISHENNIEITDNHKNIEGLYYPINSRQQISFFIDRIANVQKLWFEGTKLAKKTLLGGKTKYYYPVSDGLYKSEQTSLISLSLAKDPLDGEVIHAGTVVLKPTSSVIVYSQLTIAILWCCIIVSSILFFFVWSIRKFRGKIPGGSTITIRLWPLLAGISIVAFVLLFVLGGETPFKSFGKPSVISVSIMLSSIGFAFFAFMGSFTSIKERNTEMNKGNYWYATFSSLIHTVVAVYLLYFGIIGVMTWA